MKSNAMRMLFSISIFLVLASLMVAHGQETTISGRVVDEKGNAIPYVNILLLNKSDSAFIKGVVTDELGVFRVNCSSPEEQLLRFSSIGYQELYKEVEGGDVKLLSATYTINDLLVSGKRPIFRMKDSSLLTDVENSLLSDLGTADDVLKHLPGVNGKDGKYIVFGKGEAAIYINNRLIRDPSELERLNSRDISSVEMISNPGASYDADVRAVLIVRTRKRLEGFASQIRMRGTQNHYFSDSELLNFSYASRLFNWYALLYSSGPKSRVDGRNHISTNMTNDAYALSMDMMNWKQQSRYHSLETGFGFNIAKEQEIGLSYAYDYSRGIYEGPDHQTLLVNNDFAEVLSNNDYKNDKYNQHKVNLYYLGKAFGKLSLNFNADYVRRDAHSYNSVLETRTDGMSEVNAFSDSDYNLYAGKLVLSHPLWIGTLQFGTDLSLMDQRQKYENQSDLISDSSFDTEERKKAFFLNYSGKVGKFGWNAGIRYEHFNVNYFENHSDEPTVKYCYKDFYPTLSLSLPLDLVSLSLSYSKRMARPTFYQLRNSVDYSSRFLYSRGNPYLRASKIQDLSFNIGYRFLHFSLGFSHIKDWMRMTDELLIGEPLIIVLSHKNEPKYRSLNAQLTFQHKIGPWSPTWSAGIHRSFIDFRDHAGRALNLDDPFGDFALRNSFYIGGGFVFSVDGYYTTAGVNGQAKMKPVGSLDIGLRNSFFNGALDVNLQLHDLFRTSKTKMTIYTERLRYCRLGYQDSRNIRLTLIYRFNNYRKRYNGVNSVESEIYRM